MSRKSKGNGAGLFLVLVGFAPLFIALGWCSCAATPETPDIPIVAPRDGSGDCTCFLDPCTIEGKAGICAYCSMDCNFADGDCLRCLEHASPARRAPASSGATAELR